MTESDFKHEFKQSGEKPTSDVKFQTHHDILADLKSKYKTEFSFEIDYFDNVKSNLAVIFPSEDLRNPDNSTHFIVTPRKHEKIRKIEPKWQDKQLQGTILNLLTKDKVFAVMIPIDDDKDCLFKNHHLFPYFTCDSIISTKLSVERSRGKFMTEILKTFEVLQENGLPNIIKSSTNKFQSSNLRAILVHLYLSGDFDVIVLNEEHIERSNLFVWFLLEYSESQPTLKECCLITNSYMWLTFKDISQKHDIQESEPYNINANIHHKYYQNEKCIVMDDNVRTSHVAINQLCELDAILHQLVTPLFNIDQVPSSITMELAPATWILNTYYMFRFGNQCFDCNNYGFYRLYSHFYDNCHTNFEKLQNRDERFVGLLHFMEISKTTLSTTNLSIPKLSISTNIHYWCLENVAWNHWSESERQTINKHVRRLQKKITYQNLKVNKELYGFMQQLRNLYGKYLMNQYIYSLYYVQSMKIIPLTVLPTKDGFELYFEDGFELIVVIQPQTKTTQACMVYVQECAVVCTECVTLIQLHKHHSKQAVVVCVGLPCFVLILRRLPPRVLNMNPLS